MKSKIIAILLAIAVLVLAMAVCVSAEEEILQVCIDIVEVNGEGHESTAEMTAESWFVQRYNRKIVDEDGSIATFYIRGWVNPLDSADMLQFGYSLVNEEITWDDSFMADNEGLRDYFLNAERFDLTVDLSKVPVGTYDFHLYAKTSSGVHEVTEAAFKFDKKVASKVEEATATPAPATDTPAPATDTPAPEATEAPADTATEAPKATEAPATKSGCGSVVSFSAIALVTMLGGAIVLKKRK